VSAPEPAPIASAEPARIPEAARIPEPAQPPTAPAPAASTESSEKREDIEPGGAVVSALAVDRTAPAVLFAGTSSGIFRSTTSGETWSVAAGPVEHMSISEVALDPSDHSVVYAASDGGGVFRSSDGGVTWKEFHSGLTNGDVAALAVDPGPPAILFAGTHEGVFRLTVGQPKWQPAAALPDPDVVDLALGGSGMLYAATSGGHVFRSADHGDHWSDTGAVPWKGPVQGLAAPRVGTTVFAATSAGIFRSTDSGATWTATNTGLTTVTVTGLWSDPASSSRLYASTVAGLFRSTDGGSTWSAVRPEGGSHALAIAPGDGSTIYLGGNGAVWKSADGGRTWRAYSLQDKPALVGSR